MNTIEIASTYCNNQEGLRRVRDQHLLGVEEMEFGVMQDNFIANKIRFSLR